MVELSEDETSRDSNGHGARPEHIRVGDLLAGKYRVERIHPRGALGLTLEALHTQLGQRVALRVLIADAQAYPEAAARFLRGARSAARFQNEHSARIVDIGTLDSGAPYVVTELLAGSDLQHVLGVRDLLPVPEAVDYALQAAAGLSEAHAHGVVHRNLKPSNLFLARVGAHRRIVVLDFGVSEDPLSDVAINLGGTQRALKSLAYLAPEQIREPAAVDARADIWALGAILHEMLTGAALYEASTTPALLAMIAAEPALPASHLRPEISAELEAVLLRCLAKERSERYATLAELAVALKPFSSVEGRESALRVTKALGVRAGTSLPPPLPGQRTQAIVRVTPPPAPPVKVVPMHDGRRWGELLLTGVGLAAAGALGVFVAVHMTEGALASAIAPHAVIADRSPALPAVSPASPAALPTPLPASAPAPAPAPATALPRAVQASRVARSAPPAIRNASKAPVTERAIVADAKPVTAPGLFDEAN